MLPIFRISILLGFAGCLCACVRDQRNHPNISSHTTHPLTDHSSSLLTPQTFQTRYSHLVLPSKLVRGKLKIGLSLGDCNALLRYLERDKGVVVADDKGEVSLSCLACTRRWWLMTGRLDGVKQTGLQDRRVRDECEGM
jgi:hypothetical protein